MKLMIAVPAYETMRAEFVQSLIRLTDRLKAERVDYAVEIQTGTLVYMARDKLAHKALDGGYTHVLWLDADMVFTDSLLDDLQFSGKPFVCGLFISRHSPFLSCVFSKLLPPERIIDIPPNAFPVAGCGFAAVLIETRIIRDVIAAHAGACFRPEPCLGEDLSFCQRARNCGHEIWCEPSARVGHVGPVIIWPEDGPRLRGTIVNLTENDLR